MLQNNYKYFIILLILLPCIISHQCPSDYLTPIDDIDPTFAYLHILKKDAFHNCDHDKIDFIPAIDNNHIPKVLQEENRRLLQLNQWTPIRIKANYDALNQADLITQSYITNTFFPKVIDFMQNSLKVIQYSPNVTIGEGQACPKIITSQQYIIEADLYLLVTVSNEPSASWVAWAAPCLLSSINYRPILGQININLAHFSPDKTDYQLNIVKHEIIHVLGFSKSLYPYYIDPNTNNLLGINKVTKTITIRGVNTTIIILPGVAHLAQSYFACNDYPGLELENQGASSSLGSHWETRVLADEIMVAATPYFASLSSFTGALLEGTGWYKFDYNYSLPISWGKNKGCSFLNTSCITDKKTAISPEFCTNLNASGCIYNARFKGQCYMQKGTPSYPFWDYFGNSMVTIDQFSDNCPSFLPFSNGDCRDPNNNLNLPFFEEYYGEYGRCFKGTFILNDYSMFGGHPDYACFESHCTKADNGSFILSVVIGGKNMVCPIEGGNIIIQNPNYQGYINCPSSAAVCNIKCPNDCSGNGRCIDGICYCNTSWIGLDCSILDTTTSNISNISYSLLGNQTYNIGSSEISPNFSLINTAQVNNTNFSLIIELTCILILELFLFL